MDQQDKSIEVTFLAKVVMHLKGLESSLGRYIMQGTKQSLIPEAQKNISEARQKIDKLLEDEGAIKEKIYSSHRDEMVRARKKAESIDWDSC